LFYYLVSKQRVAKRRPRGYATSSSSSSSSTPSASSSQKTPEPWYSFLSSPAAAAKTAWNEVGDWPFQLVDGLFNVKTNPADIGWIQLAHKSHPELRVASFTQFGSC